MNRTGTLGRQILDDLREQVLTELKPIGAYLYYAAASGSQYIKFADPRIGSLRIGDHKSREKYRYKWNLIAGGERKSITIDRIERHYYPIDLVQEMCAQIRSYRMQILEKRGEYDINKDPFAGKRKRMVDHR